MTDRGFGRFMRFLGYVRPPYLVVKPTLYGKEVLTRNAKTPKPYTGLVGFAWLHRNLLVGGFVTGLCQNPDETPARSTSHPPQVVARAEGRAS